MAVAKVTLNGTTLMDTTDATADASKILNTYTAYIGDGSKATGTASGGGGSDIVTFTFEWDSSYSIVTSSCNKTFSECYNIVNEGDATALVSSTWDIDLDPWTSKNSAVEVDYSDTYIKYVVFSGAVPWADITYNSNGQIDWSEPSAYSSSLVATSNGYYGMSNGGVYYEATVNVPSSAPTLQAKTNIAPTTSSQTITPDTGYDGLSSVQINAMPSGTAGTPTATKGTVNNHSVSVTPSVTNTTGYITGSTKTGTAVTVSASELVSGSQNITTNNTYDVTNLASVVVNVSGGSSMNAQSAQSTTRATSSTYTKCVSLTCSKAGTYDVYWSTFRSSTSGTSGSQLYVDGSEYGTADTTTWSNHIQNMHLTGVAISANKEVAVYARSRGSNYYAYVGTLTIIQTA